MMKYPSVEILGDSEGARLVDDGVVLAESNNIVQTERHAVLLEQENARLRDLLNRILGDDGPALSAYLDGHVEVPSVPALQTQRNKLVEGLKEGDLRCASLLGDLERLASESTPGPWVVSGETFDEDCNAMPMPFGLDGPDGRTIWSSGSGEYAHPDMSTAQFIAASRTAVPAMIEDVRRMTVKLGDATTQYHVMRESYEPLCQERNALQAEVVRLRAKLDEREGDMHIRIRAGYDKTIADAWRARVAEAERERDEARAEVEQLRAALLRSNSAVHRYGIPDGYDRPGENTVTVGDLIGLRRM
jgi:regulator of replication initiation timing